MNLKDQILDAPADFKIKPVETPEWPVGRVYVRTITHSERRRVFKRQSTDPDLYTAYLVAAVACDAEGVRIFADEDVPRLAGKSAAVLDRIVNAWMELVTLKPEEVKALEKNS